MSFISIDKISKETGETTGKMSLEIRAYPISEPKGSTKGFASVNIDDTFGVHGISIVDGKNGLFVSMPQTRDRSGNYRDIFHPVTKEGRQQLNDAILNEYAAALDSLVTEKESTVAKLREAATAAKERPAPDKEAPAKAKGKSAQRSGEEL